MTHDEALAALTAHLRRTAALEQAAGVLAWDQNTMMPAAGAPARAEQFAALEATLHARRGDPRLPGWLDALDDARLDAAGRANAREARRAHARATRVPAALAEALARAKAEGFAAWLAARAAQDFAGFAPALARVVALTREEAACLTDAGADPYDALLDRFEPGMTGARVAGLFDRLRPALRDLAGRIDGSGRAAPRIAGAFPAEAQLGLARAAAEAFGYDFARGRLDLSVHPFSEGGRTDARITTRIDPASPFDCLFSTLHEAGHAAYEQGRDPADDLTPAGAAASLGVHESQSRLAENQIGRSRAFAGWLWPRLRAAFGDVGLDGPEALYAAANRVEPGFVRTEADEVHYNLHVMMRFDLERALVAGDLAPADLPGAWDDRFEADFGRRPPDLLRGALQDVHWSEGLIGYFPTYTLGNVYAAELWAAIGRDLPDRDAAVAAGALGGVAGWLGARIHRPGARLAPEALIAAAVGHAPTEGPLVAYLEAKFGALYGL
jgi:carboxypeptidase Taq